MLIRMKIALPVLFLALGAGGFAGAAEIDEPVYSESDYQAFARDDCLTCHEDPDLEGYTERGATLELYVDDAILKGSVHAERLCTDCHRGAKDFEDAPHNEGEPLTLNCAGSGCHGDVLEQYDRSIHGIWHAKGDQEAATCKDCHGNHDILPFTDRRSRTNAFNLHKTCAQCHESQVVLDTRPIDYDEAVPDFVDSIHGKALLVDGLIVAPTCNDCHGVHDIQPHQNPDSRISREAVPDTCGKCHVLVEDVFNASVHGRTLNAHDTSAPICTTCHRSHVSDAPQSPEFRLQGDRMCGQCHQAQLTGYRDTFHGKAIALGRQDVAACYDCHGHHDIMETHDPASYISDERRVETCRKCHEGANANFANYIVHADHHDKTEYPQLYYVFWGMTWLLIGTFVFFALHTTLWLYRSMALYMSDSREWREEKTQVREDTEEFTRFTPLERFLHGLIIISFLLLVTTGMPLKFYYTGWAKVLLDVMGGQAVAAVLHRVGAIITIFYFTVHVTSVIWNLVKRRRRFLNPETGRLDARRIRAAFFGPDSPMPGIQDLKDIVAHNKWFFGKGPKPQFDRWTYWEKFDYMAVFWGVAMIGVSGLVMWFPVFFTKVLPGWAINIALIIHSDEALLAAGFIFGQVPELLQPHTHGRSFPVTHVIVHPGHVGHQAGG